MMYRRLTWKKEMMKSPKALDTIEIFIRPLASIKPRQRPCEYSEEGLKSRLALVGLVQAILFRAGIYPDELLKGSGRCTHEGIPTQCGQLRNPTFAESRNRAIVSVDTDRYRFREAIFPRQDIVVFEGGVSSDFRPKRSKILWPRQDM